MASKVLHDGVQRQSGWFQTTQQAAAATKGIQQQSGMFACHMNARTQADLLVPHPALDAARREDLQAAKYTLTSTSAFGFVPQVPTHLLI
eukprot:5730034-Amphidinium_carterae.1